MSELIRRAAPWAITALLAAALWLQGATVSAYREAVSDLRNLSEANAAAAVEVTQAAATLASQTRQLGEEQEAIRAALSQREIDLQGLQNEVAEIRDWADAQLPSGIAGLRERPAIIGSRAYAEHLSSRNAVQPGGGAPQD